MSEELKYEEAVNDLDGKEQELKEQKKEASWMELLLEAAIKQEAGAELELVKIKLKKDDTYIAYGLVTENPVTGDESELQEINEEYDAAESALALARAKTESIKNKLAAELEDVEKAQAIYDKYKAVIEAHEAAEAAKVAAEEGRVANIHATAVVAAMVAEGHDFDHKCEPCSCPTSSEVAEAVANKLMNTGVGAVEDMANKVLARLKTMEGDSALLRVVVKVIDFFI